VLAFNQQNNKHDVFTDKYGVSSSRLLMHKDAGFTLPLDQFSLILCFLPASLICSVATTSTQPPIAQVKKSKVSTAMHLW
jgi:hypothetical protein